ncbi:hypothetical protein H2204_003346 [Knufia peltigerae]|uniref:Uncharacterized protein n=1 Tax=Knufia peltigerae TaxID=1002370 RepID=A0AA38Y975_9EURO|nr:hypothetical protein H2204_003346 [Knufia peltigerae]
MTKPFQGKTAIVTGGSRGIGAGIAKELARSGAFVVFSYASSSTKANAVVKEIESTGGRALAVKADCTEYSSAKKLVDATVEASGGKIDIIVNNAGCGDDVLLDQVDEETFDRTIYTNLRFPLTLIKEAVPFLQQGSRIVNVGSVASKLVSPYSHLYSASKAALEAVSRTIAATLGQKYSLTCNTINPGPVDTDMWNETLGREKFQATIEATPAAGRIGTVDDIVQIVKFLVSEEARWVTGNTTCANGGMLFD